MLQSTYVLCLSMLGVVADHFRWSFGSNRLQVKAETRLLSDVEIALRAISPIGSKATKTLQSLAPKHDLLLRLLDDEHMRLHVWLTPLDQEPRRLFSLNQTQNPSSEVGVHFDRIL